jgi:DNA invertase Pin-like site-specific DNA recombinase
MSQILTYLRTSTNKQDLDGQWLQILDYARTHQIEIADFIPNIAKIRFKASFSNRILNSPIRPIPY